MSDLIDRPHCGTCEYFESEKDGSGICEIDYAEQSPVWGWCPSWTEREEDET